MMLADVFCVYNRARGTDLISPEDLAEAARIIGTLGTGSNSTSSGSGSQSGARGGGGLGMRLRSFPSGLQVLQLDSFDDTAVRNRILEALETEAEALRSSSGGIGAKGVGTGRGPSSFAEDPWVSPLTAATKWRMPIQVAKQHLLAAEAEGMLCRDDTVAGLRFYLNRFQV